jgi:hypothetical protein
VNAIAPGRSSVVGAVRVLIVSASDSRFSVFLKALIESLNPLLGRSNVDFACFDIGLDSADRTWLAQYTDRIVTPMTHFGVDTDTCSLALRSFLARPFLRDYFPGYDVYVWIDSDIWLQDVECVMTYVDGALRRGMAVTHEEERAYRFQPRLFGWTVKHFLLGYGPLITAYLLTKPHVNAGFFALAADAPQWDGWVRRYEKAIQRSGALVPHDQFALNHSLHAREGRRSPAELLDPTCNWICERGVPMWDDKKKIYCKPYAPYDSIAALHLAGPAKRKAFQVKRTSGGSFNTFILRGTSPTTPITELQF